VKVLLNVPRSLEKILGNRSRPQPVGMNELAMLAFPRSYKDCSAAGAMAGFDVSQPVANHVGVLQG
jgi:hypothetical protein